MTSLFARLRQDERGATILEIALATPILLALVAGVIDVSKAYSTKLQLEQIAQRTIERVQSRGYAAAEESTFESEATAAATAAGITGTTAEITSWKECDGVVSTTNCTSTQQYATYIQMNISKTYTPGLAKFKAMTGRTTYTLRGKAAVRTQ